MEPAVVVVTERSDPYLRMVTTRGLIPSASLTELPVISLPTLSPCRLDESVVLPLQFSPILGQLLIRVRLPHLPEAVAVL